MNEEAIVFGEGNSVVGIVTPRAAGAPAEAAGVVFLNAGIVHRVGPGRLYVTLARSLSARGWTSLRFDHSGIGDSDRRLDPLPFDAAAVNEVREAMDWLVREKGCSRFVLVGLCSGTLTAFRTACRDPRVSGLVLLTALLEPPESVSEEAIQKALERRVARSYLTEKALRTGSWKKVIAGKADYRRIVRVISRTLWGRIRGRGETSPGATEVLLRLQELLRRGVSILFAFGEPTTVLEYFRMTLEPSVEGLRRDGNLEVTVIKRSDHTFTSLAHQRHIVDLVVDWIGRTNRAVGEMRKSRCS